MVLTRRASKSIIRWLPNELLSEVMLHLSRPDLVALCKTTRLTNALAIPFLYCVVVLSTLPEIENFLSTLKRYADSPVPRMDHVRQFSLPSLKLELPPDLVKEITSLLTVLPNLRCLDLLLSQTQFSDTLRHAHFPHLSTFDAFVSPDTSALLSAFIKHPTITVLHLHRTTISIPELPPIYLPHLTQFSGASSFAPSLVGVADTNSLRRMHIKWFPDDLEMDGALTALTRIVAPWHVLVADVADIAVLAFLDRLAVYMPKLGMIAFRRIAGTTSGRIPLDHAREIATKLGHFTALASLEFLGFEDDNESLTESECADTDIKIVECWAAACKTLVQVHLHGDEWRYTGMGWEIVNQTMRRADLCSLP
ncbi:hypothetical protein C8R44DRAFT_982849 [Mycena epipterygia]|nr:hypothetical protein C8R44DRAFT_982849 [Mycena epipterygia]